MLTDAVVRSLKPEDRPYKRFDTGGLHIRVSKTGSKVWRFKYTYDGRERVTTFGEYPHIGLAEARRLRDVAKGKLAHGEDPAPKPGAEEVAKVPHEMTFKTVAFDYLHSRETVLSEGYLDLLLKRLKKFLLPDLGHLHVGEVTPPVLLACLRKIEANGTYVTAHKMKTLCSQIFRFAIAEGKATRDPSQDVRGALKAPPKAKHRAKVDPAEAPQLFAAIYDYDGDALTKQALLLTLHTLVRTDEIRFAHEREFELGAEPTWRIPAERMKMGRPHLVPLSRQAAELVPKIQAPNNSSGLLFGSFTKSGVISENTMLYALYRLGYHSRQTVHGFRGLASTILHEKGFNTDWIELQLAHDDDDKVRSAYNSAQYLPQRREMMQWWSDFVERNARKGKLL